MTKHQEKRIWQAAIQHVSTLTDKLGMHVDPEIVETVAIMQLMGIHTTMSCGGHAERITGGPYVMFISLAADEFRKQAAAIGDPASLICKKLFDKAIRATLKDHGAIFRLLESFYASRKVAFRSMLTLYTFGYSQSRLQCQGADRARIEGKDMRMQILADNRAEMRAFTEYMKETYFSKLRQ